MHCRPLAALCGLLLALPLNVPAAGTLQSFRMPWNDGAATVTSLQSWQPQEAGANGWVTADADGHYQVGGQRIRFLGVNIGATDAFPTNDRANGHAARLAKFGFNAVRLHHLEAPWEKAGVLIDYASGSSRNLSAARLDRMHYFVDALAKKGIYSNINLLVSREFQAADGLGSEITQLPWKDQHILGFFHDGALTLHKEHATKLLSAPNPYRGNKPLGQDPAVAIVEIMNENGLLQKWYEGVTDKLPAPYLSALREKWNQWLQAKYANDAALLAAWGAVDQPLGSEILTNGNFNGSTTGWNLEQHSIAKATATADTGFNGNAAVTVKVTTASTEGWHVQFTQSNLSVTADQLYTLSFWAKSPTNAYVNAVLARASGDYGSIGPSLGLSLTNEWKQFTLVFTATSTESNARVLFNGFASTLHTVQFANITLKAGGKLGGLKAGEALASGNIGTVLRTPTDGAASPGQMRDWIRFVFAREKSYWETMTAHVRSLGFQGVVFATIVANSPPNSQIALDAIDSHAYWGHPAFPVGQDWSPENWTVENVSMVNSPDKSTLAGLARQRVKGKPHNVTEYEHPSPNTYGSEGPILAAAYGGLQDWDSLWMFAYNTTTSEFVTGFFDHGGHAGKMANNLLAANLFRRGDVSPAANVQVMKFTPEVEVELARTKGGPWSIADGAQFGVPEKLFAVNRLALSIGDAATGLTSPPAAPSGNVLTSDTGELVWDNSVANKGIVKVNTPRTKAIVGFVNSRSFTLDNVTIAPGATRQDWCTVGITMLTDGRLGETTNGRALIVATGDQENTGQIWKDTTRTSLGTNWGSAPTLVEVVPATITLPYAPSDIRVWALDGTGARGTALTVRNSSGKAQFDLGASGSTLWYEVQIGSGEPTPPRITTNPATQVVDAGGTAALTVGYSADPAPTFQWTKNGADLAGATSSTLTLTNVQAADSGTYAVKVTNIAGTVTSIPVRVLLRGSFTDDAGLYSLSTRAPVQSGGGIMIAGFTITGGPRKLLARASGPKLGSFGVPGTLADPKIELIPLGSDIPIFTNDSWDPALASLFTEIGAFSFAESPKEAAVYEDIPAGNMTALVKGADGGTGVSLVEVYDGGIGAGRLSNLSTRAVFGTDANALFVGFKINGTSPMRVLIRGVSPGLAQFDIPSKDLVADPMLTLFNMDSGSPRQIASNDNWGTAGAGMSDLFASVGVFGLPSGSADSAIVLWLEPGLYSAKVEAKAGFGIGIVEVYTVK
ncbi:immunoglobulin domain-containing protein [Nibricoccus sp. IMCC34717]|uniref:immunoglobulin domain-containing protein n=1 Tax=Nibricoccus sp. IMCC34717 TaxID=3034021 RepID=UPI0038500414